MEVNYLEEKSLEFCGEVLSDREHYSELCWLIEKFYAQKLDELKKELISYAWIGEERETAFFFCLDFLINQVKVEYNSKTAKSLLFEKDGLQKTFLHIFCLNKRIWSEKSFTKLLNKLKEFRKIFPEEEFKEFLIHRDFSNRTFLHLLPNLIHLKWHLIFCIHNLESILYKNFY